VQISDPSDIKFVAGHRSHPYRLYFAPELAVRAEFLEKGGVQMWDALMAELQCIHLGAPAPQRSVLAELQAAFDMALMPTRRSSASALNRPKRGKS
jgi:hypothetical protein